MHRNVGKTFFFQAEGTNLVSVIDLLDLIGLALPGPLFLG